MEQTSRIDSAEQIASTPQTAQATQTVQTERMMQGRKDKMVLAEGCVYSMDSRKTQLNNNVIVCGASGAGKTVSITEPCLLYTEDQSLVVTLSKRHLVGQYRQLFKQRGYQVYEMDLTRPEKNDYCYDPLYYVKSDIDVTMLAKMIVETVYNRAQSKADPFWEQAAISLLSAEISYIRMASLFPTFEDVLKLNDRLHLRIDSATEKTTLDAEFHHMIGEKPNSLCASCWRSFITLPEKTMSCVYGTLNSILDTLFPPQLRQMFRKGATFEFERLAEEKSVLFLVTSAVNPSLNQYVNLFYAQLFKSLFELAEDHEDGRLPNPVHVICDDFAVGGVICNFPQYISIFREKGISATLLLQSESQLEAMYGKDDAVTILNNADSYVYMGGLDLQTARAMSLRLNAPLEDVLYMPIGDVAVIRRGMHPVRTSRYRTYEDERYRKMLKRIDKDGEKEQSV